MSSPGPTYSEIGGTAGDLPTGYHHIQRQAVLGEGEQLFEEASRALMTWEMHRRAGLQVMASAEVVVLGADVRLGWAVGPVRGVAPCRVVRLVHEPRSRGFAYGTLPGHPEQGEESFTVRLEPSGAVRMEIVAFSRAALWWSRLGAPVGRVVQRRITDRYLAVLAADWSPAADRR